MINIYFDSEKLQIIYEGKYMPTSPLSLPEDSEQLLLICAGGQITPLSIHISAQGEVDSVGGLYHMDGQDYWLDYEEKNNIKVISQRDFGEHLVTTFVDTGIYVTIENSTNYYEQKLQDYPTKIDSISENDIDIFFIICPHFLSIISYDHIDYRPLFSSTFASCDFTESGITIVRDMHDNQGRVITQSISYRAGEYATDQYDIRYSCPHSVPDELVPYDFIEALLAQDYPYAEKLLNLDGDLSAKEVSQFFGEDFALIYPTAPAQDNILYIRDLSAAPPKIARYRFEITSHLITDIAEL